MGSSVPNISARAQRALSEFDWSIPDINVNVYYPEKNPGGVISLALSENVRILCSVSCELTLRRYGWTPMTMTWRLTGYSILYMDR
jgi:hypothetical protein